MADEKKPKPAWASKKFGACMLAAWGPAINEMAKLDLSEFVVVLFVVSMLVLAGYEFGLDLARIITGRGGPKSEVTNATTRENEGNPVA